MLLCEGGKSFDLRYIKVHRPNNGFLEINEITVLPNKEIIPGTAEECKIDVVLSDFSKNII